MKARLIFRLPNSWRMNILKIHQESKGKLKYFQLAFLIGRLKSILMQVFFVQGASDAGMINRQAEIFSACLFNRQAESILM